MNPDWSGVELTTHQRRNFRAIGSDRRTPAGRQDSSVSLLVSMPIGIVACGEVCRMRMAPAHGIHATQRRSSRDFQPRLKRVIWSSE
jgi:hypothetical protein